MSLIELKNGFDGFLKLMEDSNENLMVQGLTSMLGYKRYHCIIMMVGSRHLGDASIIIAKCVALRYGVLVATNNGFSNLEIEGNFKVIIDGYNKKSSLHSSIILLMEDIRRLA